MNNFDAVYYINLDHRKDRYEQITNELAKTIDSNKINRIEGVYIENFGCLGCSKSHIKALETFLNTPDNITNCIIFEDDFIFTKEMDEVNSLINLFFSHIKDFDVLMLSSNTLRSDNTEYEFIKKIIDAQTLSGYCVSKKFAPTLLENYKEGAELLEKTGYSYCDYCIDIYMKRLQPLSNWFSINPLIGKQCESYSDIEKKNVDYNC